MRYGPNFKQNLDPEELKTLPRFCTYEGNAADLKHLKGLVLETQTVEQLVYVGERENIFVTLPDGHRTRPWFSCFITEYDAEGKVVLGGWEGGHGPAPERGPNAMSTADLAKFGYTDQQLSEMAKDLLGETYEPDRLGPSDHRWDFFSRCMKALFG